MWRKSSALRVVSSLFIFIPYRSLDPRDLSAVREKQGIGFVIPFLGDYWSSLGSHKTDSQTKSEGELDADERLRYSRHLLLPEVGPQGQRKFKRASVLLVGAGGLGSPAALYLAAAGVGRLGIADGDAVEASNLQRQVVHGSADIGRNKVVSARRRLNDLNPHVQVDEYEATLTSDNAYDIVAGYDIVLDGSDNFPTRYLINDACVLAGKPNVYGSVYRFEGQASVFDAKAGPCYRCLFPEPPAPGDVPSCAEGGVLGVVPGLIGLIQATETLKLILGEGESLVGRLLVFDALAMRFRELKLAKDDDCAVCGSHPTITALLADYPNFCQGVPADAGRMMDSVETIMPATLHRRLQDGAAVELLDVREPVEREIAKLPNTIEIPLRELEDRLGEIAPQAEIVVYCRTGVRSASAAQLLRKAGFRNVKSLHGGLHAWIDDVDPTLARY